MDKIIKSCGRFSLIQTAQGFCWCLMSRSEQRWYWHPESRQWTCHPYSSLTEAEAAVGLDWALSHERAGDLDEQRDTPPTPHLAHHG